MFRSIPLAIAATCLALPALACQGFEAHDAYARTSGPTAQSGAAFMVLHNGGDQDCHIADVRSDVSARTELHTHSEDAQGVMRMLPIEGGIALPAGADHAMERGADHVMFLGLNGPLEQGTTFPVTFVFADGTESTVTITVDSERRPEAGGHDHSQMQGHGHGQMQGHGQSHAAAGSDEDQIRAVMMAQFDRPDAPLTVAPVVIEGETAMAGWAQDGRGGRALLRRDAEGWYIAMCAGAPLLDQATLHAQGLGHGAATLIAAMRRAESGGGFDSSIFDGFEDVLVFDRQSSHGQAHGH